MTKYRSIILIVLHSLFLAAAAFAQDAPKNSGLSKSQKEVLALEEAGRLKAVNGESNWDDLIAEGAYMIAFDGSIINYKKGQSLPALPLKAFSLSEMIVRVYGKVAVVTGLAEVETETTDKKPYSFQMRFLNVWERSGDSWKITVSERTGVRPPAK